MLNIPTSKSKRIVIIGGGFAGLKLASELDHEMFQVVLIDRNNYHQFQPLFYQVATAGIEPSAISFPFRKLFHNTKNFHFRLASATAVNPQDNTLITDLGEIEYDYLVLAIGADTNYYGNKELQNSTMPMKSIAEALYIRNTIIQNYENAVYENNLEQLESILNIVVVGGGPTGVEVSGALAEMKNHILPRDYPDVDFTKMKIFLIDGSPRILSTMSEDSSDHAKNYLAKLGVTIIHNDVVKTYIDQQITLQSGTCIRAHNVIWAAGITPNLIDGFAAEQYNKAKRLRVDRQNKIMGLANVYALGDNAAMEYEAFSNGHPQVAGVAQQQAGNLAYNLNHGTQKNFEYLNKGSMATVGRNLAVIDLPFMKIQGIIAWFIWMFVHLMLILGVKNKLFIFINWAWSYITFDQSLRLLIKPVEKKVN